MEEIIKRNLKVVFVGTPDMAYFCLDNILKNNFDIVGVVPPSKNQVTYNLFKQFVLSKGLNFLEFENNPNESEYCEKIKNLNADIGVVCSYNSKFSLEFLKTTKLGYINCHPSLLPQYRGANPYFHIIKNNEQISGITLHLMDENFDTGEIVYQEKFRILNDETMGTLFNRTSHMFADALVEVLNEIDKTGEIKLYPQPQGEFMIAEKVSGNFKIRWNKSATELEALIRACNPFYNAFCNYKNMDIKIIKAKSILKNHSLECGKIAKVNDKELLVCTADGFLSIEVMAMGTWGIFTPESFNRIFNPKVGESFS